jgi:hypothetical protein
MRAAGTMVEFGAYEDFHRDAFPVLGLLPSSESVAVLGHFLNDPEGRNGTTLLGCPVYKGEGLEMTVNAKAAAIAIRKLGIENPPFSTVGVRDNYSARDEEIDAWKDWWNEVKTGKRTYRFIGSDIDYGPDGPVAGDKRPQSGSGGQGAAGSTPDRNPSHWSMPLAGIVAACAFCLAAVWLYIRSWRKHIP